MGFRGDPSPKVCQAKTRALAIHPNWRWNRAAELILARYNKSAGVGDELSAVDGLGYAVKLQVRGVRQMPFWRRSSAA